MSKQLATLHAGLISRANPRPVEPPPSVTMPSVTPFPSSAATQVPSYATPELMAWRLPRVIPLRPTVIEVMPAPMSETAPLPRLAPEPATQPAPSGAVAMRKPAAPKRRATTLRLEPQLYARLRLAREQLDRTGQSILVEALADWLVRHEVSH